MKRIGVFALAGITALTLGCNSSRRETAANNPPATGGAVGTAGTAENGVPKGDRTFAHDVTGMNMAEIDLARLAVEHSPSADVKKLAQTLIDDHTAAGEKLSAIASQNSIDVPAQIDDKDRDRHETLAKKQGLDFDKDWADAMIDGHKDLLDKLESRIDKDKLGEWKTRHEDATGKKVEAAGEDVVILPEKSDNPITSSINQWAATTYPVAFAHLSAVKALKDALKKRSTD
jgi:putative membrane protein